MTVDQSSDDDDDKESLKNLLHENEDNPEYEDPSSMDSSDSEEDDYLDMLNEDVLVPLQSDDEDSDVSDYDEVSIDETAPSGRCW